MHMVGSPASFKIAGKRSDKDMPGSNFGAWSVVPVRHRLYLGSADLLRDGYGLNTQSVKV